MSFLKFVLNLLLILLAIPVLMVTVILAMACTAAGWWDDDPVHKGKSMAEYYGRNRWKS